MDSSASDETVRQEARSSPWKIAMTCITPDLVKKRPRKKWLCGNLAASAPAPAENSKNIAEYQPVKSRSAICGHLE
ncbi:hypothetical protein R1sor_024718 [Riccia sorocarpa]|uniref:Uncharacterized protein n=1 Tax=Riccia sorocarpa TaxID=122646 RepID=A0ABD3GTJ2_9MARC